MGGSLIRGEEAGAWVAERVGGAYFAARSTALGYALDGRITAGVIYENYNAASVVAHIAVEGRRMSPNFVSAIFDYPFRVCGVAKIICPVGEGNIASRNLAGRMGFREECRLAGAHPDGDLIFYTLTRQDCRFLGGRYGQKFTFSATPA